MRSRLLLLALSLLVVPAQGAHALLITDPASILSPMLIDMEHLANASSFTTRQIGSMVGLDVVSAADPGAAIVSGSYGFGTNGTWSSGNRKIVSSGLLGTVAVRFDFNFGPVSGAGVFMNYHPDAHPTITIAALDANGNVLEIWDLTSLAPIVTPNGVDGGAFRGIQRSQADIYALEFRNSIAGRPMGFDNLRFSSVVPEPSTALLLGGAAGMIAARRRRA